jgi:hypothetical protein
MDAASTERRLRMCHGKHRGQYQSDTITERVWQKLSPVMILMLLENAAQAARYQAKALLGLMENHTWRITAAPHEGGTGDQRGVDTNLHITVRVAGQSYHLRCKELPALHIVQITA